MKGGLGEAADRAGLMRMTLKVAENRKILSFFICMQIRLLHKLTPEPRCQSSSWVEAGPPLGPHGRSTHPLFPSQVSSGLRRESSEKAKLSPPRLFTAFPQRQDCLKQSELILEVAGLISWDSRGERR